MAQRLHQHLQDQPMGRRHRKRTIRSCRLPSLKRSRQNQTATYVWGLSWIAPAFFGLVDQPFKIKSSASIFSFQQPPQNGSI
eukprot:2694714-Amphidinium_carterae.1